jgi:hypothetical protein
MLAKTSYKKKILEIYASVIQRKPAKLTGNKEKIVATKREK